MKKVSKSLEKVAGMFAALMIQKISEIEEDWKKPWLTVKRKNFIPRNITGRRYSGGNILMLLFYSMIKNYRTPVFLTFKQAQERDLHIIKGAKSFTVYHFVRMYLNKITNEKLSETEFRCLPETEQDNYKMIPILKYFDVFNLDQTNFPEIFPDKWQELLDQHEGKVELNTTEMISYARLDKIFEDQSWVCPIQLYISNRAYYSPAEDRIVLPLKAQFREGQDFYSTALHEMIHSTGYRTRLNRIKPGNTHGSEEYAKEELIAELSAALLAYYMGIETNIRDDHASYLKHWIKHLKQDPTFLMDVLGDVVKAVNYTCEKLQFNPFENEDVLQPEVRKNEEVLVIID